MAAPFAQTSFSRGEIAPSLWGHVDLAAFHTACATLRNMFVGYRGGAYSRAGTRFVGRSKQRPDLGQVPPRLVPFQFSINQTYALEFGDGYVRFITAGGFVTETPIAVTAASQANPCQISAAHNFVNGDWVAITGIISMVQLNGNSYIVANANIGAGTFTLQDLDGNPVNSTGYGVYGGGGTVARLYTVATPYSAIDLPLLKWAQSADVLSLAHPNYPPQELSRLGPVNWTLAPASFGATIAPPASATATATVAAQPLATPPTLPTAYAYVVTAVDPVTGQESVAGPIANVTNSVDTAATAGAVVVSWAAVIGADHYNIYKAPPSYNTALTGANALPVPIGAVFGYTGSSYGNQFADSNVTPNTALSPPLHKNPFAPGQASVSVTNSSTDWTHATVAITTATGSGFIGQPVIIGGAIVAVITLNAGQNYRPGDTPVFTGDGSSVTSTSVVGPLTGTYPGVVAYFQERRVYAQSLNSPDTYWMSQPGGFLNYDSSLPVNDADAITATPTSDQVNGIVWLVQMPLGLVTFTGGGVYQIGAPGSVASSPAAITPSNQVAAPQSSIGSSATVPPVRIGWEILHAEPDSATVLDLTYQLFFNIYTGNDLSWPSSHLLAGTGHTIREWAWSRKPNKLLWMARDDGILLSLTYLKEQEVSGWARHDTYGQVRSLCAITELPVDALYLAAERPVPAGGTRFFLERMDNRLWQGVEDAWCVDCAVATSPATPNAGLSAGAASGAGVTFTATANVFSVGQVGSTLRMGGGLATVTGYIGPAQVTGAWLSACRELWPNGPGTPLPQPSGKWSIAQPSTAVSGLAHLAGMSVSGLADGVPVGPLAVSATGTAVLPFAASKIVLGLPFTAQLQSVYLDTGLPTVQGRRQAIFATTVRVEASYAKLQAGANQPDASAQSPAPLFASWPLPPARVEQPAVLPSAYSGAGGEVVQPLFTGDLRLTIPSDWQKPGQVAVQQALPVPLNVLALVPEVLGGDQPEEGYSPRPRAQAGAGRSQRMAA